MRSYFKGCKGFSLIEAMVATAIIGVGFVGTMTLTGVAQQSSNESILRQKLQMQANQILEIIESDIDNIDDYNLDLSECPASAGATTIEAREYEWCTRMENEAGAATANDTRTVTVTTLADGSKAVEILLEALGGRVQTIMKRVYD